jgi:ubiquinone/menaquinone biosynthesis C-methylase UbiE
VSASSASPLPPYVPETAFGKWFLHTRIWTEHVLERALKDLERLIPEPRDSYPTIIDVGVGWGRSLAKLDARFKPQRLIAMDVDPAMVEASAREAAAQGLRIEPLTCSACRIALPDASVDLLFCHQTFHHLIDQVSAMREFHRVLRPGGLMLFAESTSRYIRSWIIQALFRHPMDVQKTAPEYLALARTVGFEIAPGSISYPYLWWSREDLGIMERWFGIQPPVEREETLINFAAVRSA